MNPKVLLHYNFIYEYLIAQHNAAKAIAPASVQLLQKAFLNSNDNLQLATSVLNCETAVVHTLLNTRPDQVHVTFTIQNAYFINSTLLNFSVSDRSG